MFMGEEELEEGLKARKTVKAIKANMKAKAKALALWALRREKRLLSSKIRFSPWMNACLVAFAMWVSFCGFLQFR
ncbi:hypothetical protein U1Q18_014334 [Sarracenia purpurea var. burkii]